MKNFYKISVCVYLSGDAPGDFASAIASTFGRSPNIKQAKFAALEKAYPKSRTAYKFDLLLAQIVTPAGRTLEIAIDKNGRTCRDITGSEAIWSR